MRVITINTIAPRRVSKHVCARVAFVPAPVSTRKYSIGYAINPMYEVPVDCLRGLRSPCPRHSSVAVYLPAEAAAGSVIASGVAASSGIDEHSAARGGDDPLQVLA